MPNLETRLLYARIIIDMTILIDQAGTEREIKFRTIDSNEDIEKLSLLLDECFCLTEGKHFLVDFPVWRVIGRPEVERLGAFIGNELIGSVGIRHATLRLKDVETNISLLGAVVTQPGWRRRGISKNLIAQAEGLAKEKNSKAVFLWGSEHQFYTNLGYDLCGVQARIPLNELPRYHDDINAIQVKFGFSDEILKMKMDHSIGLKVDEFQLKILNHHSNVKWYTATQSGKCVAYAGLGRGIDLIDIIHEWGGTKSGIRAILDNIVSKNSNVQIIGNPSLLEKFQLFVDKPEYLEFVCLGKILDDDYYAGKGVQQAFGPSTELKNADLWFWGLDSV